MKLSKKLVQKWKNQCRDEAMRVTGDYIDLEQLAELAAAWGAEQSLDGKRLASVMLVISKWWHALPSHALEEINAAMKEE